MSKNSRNSSKKQSDLDVFKSKLNEESESLDMIAGGILGACHDGQLEHPPVVLTEGSCNPTCQSHHCR